MTTIYSIAESPKDPNLIWAGTDDGNLQISRDAGKTWKNVAGNVAGLPKYAWVSSIEAGHFDAGTAYATFDLHTFGDMKAYVYRTTDFGKTWTPLAPSDGSMKGYAHVVKEDLVNRDLLFVGTELGLWISLDGGKQWAQYKGAEMPNVAVHDLAIHPRDAALVIATHGRGIWIVDDITPLRALTADMLSKEAAFVPGKPAVQRILAQGGWVNGDAAFEGPNPPGDALITYYQKKRHIFGDLTIEILKDGEVLDTIPTSKRRGLSRATWSMRLKAPRTPAAASAVGAAIGPRLVPGTYTVRMTKNKQTYTEKLVVVADPRSKHTPEDRQAEFDLAMKLYRMLGDMTFTVDQINGVRADLEARAARLPAGDPLAATLRTAAGQADALRKKVVATTEGGAITGEERLREYVATLYSNVVYYEGRPTQTQVDRTAALGRELSDVVKEFDAWAAKELPGINKDLSGKSLASITLQTRPEWEKQGQEAK